MKKKRLECSDCLYYVLWKKLSQEKKTNWRCKEDSSFSIQSEILFGLNKIHREENHVLTEKKSVFQGSMDSQWVIPH